MVDAIDELVARSKRSPEVTAFHEIHRAHPEILDFLVQEIQLRIDSGFEAFSYPSLWHYARWKLELQAGPGRSYKMNDHAEAFYGRAITILHPEFNGRAEFRKSRADEAFGTQIEPPLQTRPKSYARRLQWSDGTPLEQGWRPRRPHVPRLEAKRKSDLHAR